MKSLHPDKLEDATQMGAHHCNAMCDDWTGCAPSHAGPSSVSPHFRNVVEEIRLAGLEGAGQTMSSVGVLNGPKEKVCRRSVSWEIAEPCDGRTAHGDEFAVRAVPTRFARHLKTSPEIWRVAL